MKSKLLLYLVFFILFFTFISAFAATKEQYLVKVESVHDGDTFSIIWPELPFGLDKVGIRINGIDAPEIHSKCLKEKEHGEISHKFLENLINKKQVIISNCSNDKYGGRWVCDVQFGTENLSSLMIVNGFAREYHGDKKKAWSWCST